MLYCSVSELVELGTMSLVVFVLGVASLLLPPCNCCSRDWIGSKPWDIVLVSPWEALVWLIGGSGAAG